MELCHEKVLQVVAEWAQVLHKRYQPGFISTLAAPYPARNVGCAGGSVNSFGFIHPGEGRSTWAVLMALPGSEEQR